MKLSLMDKLVLAQSAKPISIALGALSFLAIFWEVQDGLKLWAFIAALCLIALIHVRAWQKLNALTDVKLRIDNTTVNLKVGDLFEEKGLKVIAFNEYFDTIVDNVLIAENTLNGKFLKEKLSIEIKELDRRIRNHKFFESEILDRAVDRRAGKRMRYRLGTVYEHEGDYLLVAFSKFNEKNKAVLTMPQYLEFMINFWDNINRIYAARSVATTIMGSGITSISEHKNISPHELLKIMLWTFRVSETRFAHPAVLSIVIAPDLIDQINLPEIQAAAQGL
jgi:hypothetical protein